MASNAEVYRQAKRNLEAKREDIGYVQLVTDCWGMLVEFEYEWHRQHGGQTRIDGIMPKYKDESDMRKAMLAAKIDDEQLVHTLNWKHLKHEEDAVEVGDCAIFVPSREGFMYYQVWFYGDDGWEISAPKGINKAQSEFRLSASRFLVRKKRWEERSKNVKNERLKPSYV